MLTTSRNNIARNKRATLFRPNMKLPSRTKCQLGASTSATNGSEPSHFTPPKCLRASRLETNIAQNYNQGSILQYCACNSAMLHFNFNMPDNQPEYGSRRRIALGVTGGIAAYKSIEILRALQRAGCEVRVAMTRHACEFIQPLTFRALSGSYVLVDD